MVQSGLRGRLTGLLAALAVGSVSLSGCAAGTSDSASDTLTVQVVHGDEAVIESFITLFEEKYPEVTVKTTAVSQTAKTGSNIQVLTSDGAPDVAMVPINSQAYTNLANGDQLVDLNSVWESSDLANRFGPAIANALLVDGKPYAVPYSAALYNIVYYNTELFTQLGIPAPENHRFSSLGDLEDVVATLHAAGKDGLAIGPADNYQASWLVDAFLPTSASEDQLTNYLTSWQGGSTEVTAKYTDPAFTDVLARIQSLGSAGVFQDGYLGQKVAQAEALFIQGQAGMLLDGNWSIAALTEGGISFDFDWALLPPVNATGTTQLNTYYGNAFAIPVKASNPELAKKFLEVVESVEGQSSLIANGQLPIVNDVPADAYSSLPVQIQTQLADIAEYGGLPGWTSVVPGGLGQQLIDPLIQEMLNGNGTPESIGAAVQDELETQRSAQ